ncbi:MAG: SDR family NAD(P)-dependent oxidoreductase [Azospirillum sp.]|nr:SDR family NAD(P)-dependent oxidoreductase [Azospirillum sp.]
MREPKTIVITGASSGLGAALARAYAAPGIRLALTGRDAGRLAAVAAACRGAGAETRTGVLDLRQRADIADWLVGIDEWSPVDLVVANAGISLGTASGKEGEARVRAVFETNLDGLLNTVLPLIPALRARRGGQIALMSSLAAFRGLPGSAAYCATKAAVRLYGEALRVELAAEGVEVSVICPGYIETPMTAVNRFAMPLLMDADRAARIIRRGLARNRARIAFPWPTYAVAWLLGVLSPGLTDRLMRGFPRKA